MNHECDMFIPIVSKRNENYNKLAVITSFFNPCNYTNLKNNFLIFQKHIQQYADLFVIELSFDNNFFIKHDNHIRIQGRTNNIFWQKERLLNILLDIIPKNYTNIAWIDADILFDDPSWVDKLNHALSEYKIVHLFDIAHRIELKHKPIYSRLRRKNSGATGFAWAARRDIIDNIKFLDNQILGSADYIMCSAFMKHPTMLDTLYYYINNEYTKEWIKKTEKIVDRSVICLNNTVTHLYHGSEKNRSYTDRYSILKNVDLNKITIQNNLWTSEDEDICTNILKYFMSRKEDDAISIE